MSESYVDSLKIYLDRLSGGESEQLNLSIDPQFMDVEDPELAFNEPVELKGQAYLADKELIINLDIHTQAQMPCKICNEICTVEVKPENLYHVQSVTEISAGLFDLAPVLREHILIETPHYAECNGGHCTEREAVSKYMASEGNDPDKPSLQTNPFTTL